ncbi:copper amine oxidase N-terminal domain-containing protein [Peptoniphilus raoultii]|uniref:copper amine oxidase N-terminal domain-containing protein n=1 Tax=Peptoniphilus raoultii TaxID=1776387 RepID=UPI001FD70416|nr:copper amine oxidase N-terminal domain-containing protein [Peptoniphilus raoultii]
MLCVKTYVTDGGKGAGEQKTYLKFDWSNANEVKADDAKEAPKTDANAEAKADQKANDEIKINVNGKGLKPETPAYIENGRTMVSLRFISEALGEKVDWKAETKIVVIGDNKASLAIGAKEIEANGKKITIDFPAIVKNARTFVPLRAISEILGAKVDWDGSSRTVRISK